MIAAIAMISSSGVVPFVEDVEANTGHGAAGNGKSTLPSAPPPKPTSPGQDTITIGPCGSIMTCADNLDGCDNIISCKDDANEKQIGIGLRDLLDNRELEHDFDWKVGNNNNELDKGDSYVPYFPTPQECSTCIVDSSILIQ